MRDAFKDFLRAVHAADNAMPATLQQVTTAGVRLVVADRADPDDLGFECLFSPHAMPSPGCFSRARDPACTPVAVLMYRPLRKSPQD